MSRLLPITSPVLLRQACRDFATIGEVPIAIITLPSSSVGSFFITTLLYNVIGITQRLNIDFMDIFSCFTPLLGI